MPNDCGLKKEPDVTSHFVLKGTSPLFHSHQKKFLDNNTQDRLFSMIGVKDLLKFLGVSQAWRQYFQINLATLLHAYPMERPFVMSDSLAMSLPSNTICVLPKQGDVFSYRISLSKRVDRSPFTQQLKDQEHDIDNLTSEELIKRILRSANETIEKQDKYLREILLSGIPETSLLTAYLILRLLKKYPNQSSYEESQTTPFELLYDMMAFTPCSLFISKCHKHIDLAYLAMNDPWMRNYLPRTEKHTPSRYYAAFMSSLSAVVVGLAIGLAVVIMGLFIGAVINIATAPIELWLPAVILTLSAIVVFPLLFWAMAFIFHLCTDAPPSATIKSKADAYFNMVMKIPDEKKAIFTC